MKKEFGKWFLDLAKYILTAIILTAFFAGLEQTIVLWGALIFFLISIVVGYILLVQADKENLTLLGVRAAIYISQSMLFTVELLPLHKDT